MDLKEVVDEGCELGDEGEVQGPHLQQTVVPYENVVGEIGGDEKVFELLVFEVAEGRGEDNVGVTSIEIGTISKPTRGEDYEVVLDVVC